MATYYSQEYPLGSASVSGNNLTVDLMLKEPTRINAYLSDIALRATSPSGSSPTAAVCRAVRWSTRSSPATTCSPTVGTEGRAGC